MRRIAITGMGIASCLGNDLDSVSAALRAGRAGIRFLPYHAEHGLRSQVGGAVDVDLDAAIDRKLRRFMSDAAAYITVAPPSNPERAFASACHGVGPGPSPPWMVRAWQDLENLDVVRRLGMLVHGSAASGVVETDPEASSDFGVIADVAEQVGLTKRVARLEPLIHIQG